ncbi:MAG: rhomboid family intramembrane serine protease [Sandaracinaceae bacterium]|nr:rhomboid family intramembrane serine protease [Sandaracinaceae bacterium]
MSFNFPPLTPLVKRLLIFLGVAFVLVAVLDVLGVHLYPLLALTLSYADGVPWSLAWEPFTYWAIYPPAPPSLVDVLLTLLMLYFFLSPFEATFGAKRAVILSVLGVLAAALVAVPLAFFLPRPPLAGASAISAAAFGAFPVLFRDREIMLFPLLIKMKPWTALLIGLGISALMAVLYRDPHVFAVHAAAMGAGVAYATWLVRPAKPSARPQPRKRGKGGPDLRVIEGGADRDDDPRWLN